jgi:hypothetical protein
VARCRRPGVLRGDGMAVTAQTAGIGRTRRRAGRTAPASGRWREQVAQWIRPTVAAAWMNLLIMAVAVVTVASQSYLRDRAWPESDMWGVGAMKLFALWCMSFLPGWLYIRFLGLRAAALWAEYVLSLHRLGWDHPGHLPAPPRSSEYYRPWLTGQPAAPEPATGPAEAGPAEPGPAEPTLENIYRQKFDAYYGRQVAASTDSPRDFRIKVETLFPVFLTTMVLAVGWAGVLWDTSFVTTTPDAFGMLKYAFLGAYTFIIGMLIRRFYQGDLRPSAYAGAVLRVITVLVTVAALHAVCFVHAPQLAQAEVAVAFSVGVFPLAGLEALRRIAASALKHQLPQVEPDYPLNQLDGLNIWYEARLAEEGVEDMQNLTTMNLVDVILHTRVPVGRLIDWVDQAFLMIHLEPAHRDQIESARHAAESTDQLCSAAGAPMRVALRRMGIRTATDLLAVFSAAPADDPAPAHRQFRYRPCPIAEPHLRLLVTVLLHEQGLTPVWNWRHNGCPARLPTT